MALPPAAVAETHSAVVFFVGDRAYKLKKPVDLGFLDFRTEAARAEVCREEVRLNRRLSPDVYLGVADVTGVDGVVCDHLVVMRRMPEDRRLSTLVEAGAEVGEHLWHLAHQLATFHAASHRSAAADHAAGLDATRDRWNANTDGLLPFAGGEVFDDLLVATVHGLAMRYLDGRGPLFASRVARGRAVDGHGDLLADDIFCLDDGPRVLDCIEFDESLRLGDGLADVAFLAMDLERLGRHDLADSFLAAYREHASDVWPASLAHHHIAYRAQVRAKVSAIRATQGDPAALRQAVGLLDLAAHHLERARVRLVLVGGLPGTGKSALALGLAERLDLTVLRSDELRKELSGLSSTSPAPATYGHGIYASAMTDRTYEELLVRAETALAHGESVVLDASWHDEGWRVLARTLARRTSADLVELCCEAPPSVAAERMTSRARAGDDPSDATPEIAATMAGLVSPWPRAIVIDTSGELAAAVDAAELQLVAEVNGGDTNGYDNGTDHRRSVPAG